MTNKDFAAVTTELLRCVKRAEQLERDKKFAAALKELWTCAELVKAAELALGAAQP